MFTRVCLKSRRSGKNAAFACGKYTRIGLFGPVFARTPRLPSAVRDFLSSPKGKVLYPAFLTVVSPNGIFLVRERCSGAR